MSAGKDRPRHAVGNAVVGRTERTASCGACPLPPGWTASVGPRRVTALNLPLRCAVSQAPSVELLPGRLGGAGPERCVVAAGGELAQVLAVGASLPWNTADHGRKSLLSLGTWREGSEARDQHGELTV